MRWEDGQWIDEGRVPTSNNVTSLVEEADGTLWAGNQTAGVLRVAVPATGMRDAKVERFTEQEGLGKSRYNVFLADGQIFVIPFPLKDILRWDATARRFVPDNRFLLPVNNPDAAASLHLLPNGDILSVNGSYTTQRQASFAARPMAPTNLTKRLFAAYPGSILPAS